MTDKLAWQFIRKHLVDMGDGELHGDEHHDDDCAFCQLIAEFDRKFQYKKGGENEHKLP